MILPVTLSGERILPELRRMDSEFFIPPINFAAVDKGVYRSGYPSRRNFSFLRNLKLKTVVYLCPEDYAEENADFFASLDTHVYHFKLEGNKEPVVDISEEEIRRALKIVLDRRNHPLLIHCNKGKHRTGCLVGSLRKMQQWSLTSIFSEYQRFAGAKGRLLDQQFIELMNPKLVDYDLAHKPDWL